MLCPMCQETLQMTDRQGVEVDYCPKCRGVWLDRGELQKLIDLSIEQVRSQPAPRTAPDRDRPHAPLAHYGDDRTNRGYEDRSYGDRDYDRRRDSYEGSYKHKKKESWFSELFDFD